jgi:hypothetical protein
MSALHDLPVSMMVVTARQVLKGRVFLVRLFVALTQADYI